jgi:hypothetical protein
MQPDAPAVTVRERKASIPAAARVTEFGRVLLSGAGDLASRAVACVDEIARPQDLERVSIDRLPIGLPPVTAKAAKTVGRKHVGPETKPIEIVENRRFVLLAAPRAVVIFDGQ